MNQRLISSRFPYLPIQLHVRDHTYDGEALLDTGFDGGIVMPPHFFSGEETPDHHVWWTLADASRRLAPVYRGSVELEGLGSFPIFVTVLGDEPIIGLEVINRFSVLLDHGQRVIVEP